LKNRLGFLGLRQRLGNRRGIACTTDVIKAINTRIEESKNPAPVTKPLPQAEKSGLGFLGLRQRLGNRRGILAFLDASVNGLDYICSAFPTAGRQFSMKLIAKVVRLGPRFLLALQM
jgi:hypothetical protein